jgi:hypothetical protein
MHPSRSSAALCLARAGKHFGTERFANEIVVVEMSMPVVENVSFGHPDGGHGTKTLVHDDKVSLVNGCFVGAQEASQVALQLGHGWRSAFGFSASLDLAAFEAPF